MGFGCGGVLVFLGNVFTGEGGPLFKLAFLPIEEKNPPEDLLADSCIGICRDRIEGGGDITIEFCVKVRVMGARDG